MVILKKEEDDEQHSFSKYVKGKFDYVGGVLVLMVLIWIFFGVLRATNIRNSIIAENRHDAAIMNIDTFLSSVRSICLNNVFEQCLTLPSPKKSKILSLIDPYAKENTYTIVVTPDGK